MRSHPPVSPFPPRTGLAGAIDDAIARLVELRQREICAKTPDPGSSAAMRLEDLGVDAASIDMAKVVDFGRRLTAIGGPR